jgi:ribosome-associated protein
VTWIVCPWERKRVTLEITTDYIKLDSFLKAVNAVGSGGQAKQMIADRLVRVNGQVELRRGRKLYPGDRVSLGRSEFTVEKAVRN